jgi:hypothetical protein
LVGAKGDIEIKQRLADAIAGCLVPNLRLVFFECNLLVFVVIARLDGAVLHGGATIREDPFSLIQLVKEVSLSYCLCARLADVEKV